MAICENCGNEYSRSFDIISGDKRHTFDSFECAISVLAPRCTTCETAVIGHGVEAADGRIFCSAHCADKDGVAEVVDHVRS